MYAKVFSDHCPEIFKRDKGGSLSPGEAENMLSDNADVESRNAQLIKPKEDLKGFLFLRLRISNK